MQAVSLRAVLIAGIVLRSSVTQAETAALSTRVNVLSFTAAVAGKDEGVFYCKP